MSPFSPPRKLVRGVLVCAGLVGSAVCLCPGTGAFAAAAPPLPARPAAISDTALLNRLHGLYLAAEQAAEEYDGTQEQLGMVRARERAQQPRFGGPALAAALPAGGPAAAEEQRLLGRQQAERARVLARLADVNRLLAGLTRPQLARLAALEQRGAAAAQRALFGPGRPAIGNRMPSAVGRKAVAYAYRQLGKPYAWGSSGPDAFDCSGLTSQAWAHAGRHIPRTSQGQWARLHHVPLSRLRPGDLVVYYPGATHVAIYVGAGRVVQAPRPGRVVSVTPLAAEPVLGAVRPDSDRPSLPRHDPEQQPPDEWPGPPDGSDPAQPAVG